MLKYVVDKAEFLFEGKPVRNNCRRNFIVIVI